MSDVHKVEVPDTETVVLQYCTGSQQWAGGGELALRQLRAT
jgi:hypothetical protein